MRVEQGQRGGTENLQRVGQGQGDGQFRGNLALDHHAEQDQVEEEQQDQPDHEGGALRHVGVRAMAEISMPMPRKHMAITASRAV